jgi:3-oxoacyl-[acyl-carrier protein] reductase
MDLGLKGKKAIVTGGTRGIGRGIAETLADEGCDVAVCARTEDAVNETVEVLKGKGVNATGKAFDVADGPTLKAWVAAVGDEFGGLDIYVSNVSAMGNDADEAEWRKSFEMDIMGTVNGIEAATPMLIESGDGAIVVVGSLSTVEANRPWPYASVKAALLPYVKGLSASLARKGVRANTVTPGVVHFEGGVWDMVKNEYPDHYEKTLKRCKLGRMVTPQDIANAVAFLASPAAGIITGANLIVDAGYTRRINY